MRTPRTESRLFGVYFSRGVLVAALAAATVLTLFAGSEGGAPFVRFLEARGKQGEPFDAQGKLKRGPAIGSTKSSNAIEQVLQEAVGEKKLPGVVAMVAVGDRVVYEGASGKRDTIKNIPMTADAIFRIASMTKPVTSVAVMQLVESGRVKLDEPAATYLPELAQVQVLEEFDAGTGKAKLRPPKSPPTVRQLLSHTSGFVYEFFDHKLHDYAATGAVPSLRQGDDGFLKAPLVFDPGSRWEYGINTDLLGRLVEKVSGQTLEEYFRKHILEPLGMTDTFFNVPAEKQARVVALDQRQEDGSFVEPPPQPFQPVRFFSGGGGLYSTASDYLNFTRMLLGEGKFGNKRILRAETVAEMSRNQIGDLTLVELRSMMPQFARDPVRVPGSLDKFGLGFGINSKAVEGGRSQSSLAWAGIYNTFFWIDPPRKTCAVLMMQILPFGDGAAYSVVEQFERAVYANGW
ncbi:MAG: 1,4-butanediol diacrylate esterase [Acidobacteria bacterium]|nr:MAG: 1,4-butanediol diacrylate esterase [Acidobacteriota bacterium]